MKKVIVCLILASATSFTKASEMIVAIEGFSNQKLSIVMNGTFFPNVMNVGEVANRVVIQNGWTVYPPVYVVNSGSFPSGVGARILVTNTPSLCQAALNGTVAIPDTIDLPDGSNPYDLELQDGTDFGYVSTLGNSKVYKLNLFNKTILDSVSVGPNPEGLLLHNNQLFVANSGFGSGNTVSVINLSTFAVTDTIEVMDNPQDFAYYAGKIYTICSGAFGSNSGTVVVFDALTHTITDTMFFGNSPGNIEIINDLGFCGDAFASTNAGVYTFDAGTNTVLQNSQTQPAIQGGYALGGVFGFYLGVANSNILNLYNLPNLSFAMSYTFANSIQHFDYAFGIIDEAKEVGKTELVKNFLLAQNYPNPFNPSTTISYGFPLNSQGKFVIFNVLGEVVQEFELENSKGKIVWNGTDQKGKQVSSGIYFYRLQSGNFSETKKMLLLR